MNNQAKNECFFGKKIFTLISSTNKFLHYCKPSAHFFSLSVGHLHLNVTFSILFSILPFLLRCCNHSTWIGNTIAELVFLTAVFSLTFPLCSPRSAYRHPAKEDPETPWPAVLGESLFLLTFSFQPVLFCSRVHTSIRTFAHNREHCSCSSAPAAL